MGGRERGADNFHAERLQDEDILKWAKANGHEIVQTWPELGLSGAKWAERKGFQELLAKIETGELDGIIVAYLSRFARTMRVAYKAIDRLEDAGGVFISVADNIDLTTTEGIGHFNMKMTMAEWEYGLKRDGFIRIQQECIADGIPMRTCFGYKRGPDRRLVPDAVEAPWVKRIFSWRCERMGWRAIADRLNAEGAPPPSEKSKAWTATTVRNLVERRTYLGEVWHDKERENVHRGAHEPLVDEVTFMAANSIPAERYDRHRHHLLAGLLRCAGCRYKIKATTAKPRGGAEYVSYICRGTHGGGKCPDPVRVTELQLVPLLRREFMREANLIGKRFRQVSMDSGVTRLRDEVTVLERRYESWVHDEDLREDDHTVWREGRKERKAALEAKREQLSTAMRAANMKNAPTEVEASWPEESAEQRKLLQAVFEQVWLRGGADALGDRIHVIPKGAATPEVPVPGKVFDLRPFVWHDDPVRAGEAET
jgi:DNA invertase Pin-like site-specific DNA recombinase